MTDFSGNESKYYSNQVDHCLNPISNFLEKLKNSVLTPKFIWNHIVKDYEKFNSDSQGPLEKSLNKMLQKIFWFWPVLREAEPWRDAQIDGDRGPQNYINLDTFHSQLLINEIEVRFPDKEKSLLDLGCNVGRYLNYFSAQGYKNITGIDISDAAFAYMDEIYPGLKEKVTTKNTTMQQFLIEAESSSYDCVYTHGATVELIHPSFPLVKEIARIAKNCIVFLISEPGHGYPRFWEYEFARQGYILTRLLRPAESTITESSLMVFAREGSVQQ